MPVAVNRSPLEACRSKSLEDRAERYCIVGAGSSGLAIAKNFAAAGIPFDCLEREDDVGGNWYYGKPASSVYASTRLISSKRLTEYVDFPIPEAWPEYLNRRQAWEYLRDYARTFGLYDQIEFNAAVAAATPLDGGGWKVELADGGVRRYAGLVIANGHNWDPRRPEYAGQFAGDELHSSEYKTPESMRGRRVLVVGGGNSGCDLAVEAAIHAERAVWSRRRSYPILPKFFRGRPIDQCGELLLWLRLPLWARRLASGVAAHFVLGPAWRTGVPRPDHRLFESHPIINSQVHHHVAHGSLELRPDVARLAGDRVEFVDGSVEPIDLVIYATGFRVTIPFVDAEHLNWRDGAPRLFLNIFHPQRDDLFCAGLIQPDSGQWGLADYQARLIAAYVLALRRGSSRGAWFRRLKAGRAPDLSHGIRFLATPRHALEIEHFSYRRRLKKLIRKLA